MKLDEFLRAWVAECVADGITELRAWELVATYAVSMIASLPDAEAVTR